MRIEPWTAAEECGETPLSQSHLPVVPTSPRQLFATSPGQPHVLVYVSHPLIARGHCVIRVTRRTRFMCQEDTMIAHADCPAIRETMVRLRARMVTWECAVFRVCCGNVRTAPGAMPGRRSREVGGGNALVTSDLAMGVTGPAADSAWVRDMQVTLRRSVDDAGKRQCR